MSPRGPEPAANAADDDLASGDTTIATTPALAQFLPSACDFGPKRAGHRPRDGDEKASKEGMHLDLETDDIEAEVRRLEALGAKRWDHHAERGFEFWVLRDP